MIPAELKPEILLSAYASGIFPMAEPDGEILWFRPDPRAIIPLDGLRVSRSLRATLRRDVYECRIDSAFAEVIRLCARRREKTWISPEIQAAYIELHRLGFAHSVESWKEGELAGGLYGVALGGAFFGESMFSRATDASKAALVHLVERMKAGGFTLLDTQFMTEHLRGLGAIDVSRKEYERRLKAALRVEARFADAAG
ncbi:MAG: leucyl/phenylalanyl-tRNA--protein transferase [Phycisphaerales bacterium]|nr:leucyl/phenylalanyl-tRNA--protein transferase [Phycisphaerales bacterium]